ncbi:MULTISPECIES: DUF6802 family protein [Actinoalloteichus]|uniref:DUF6802 domain-containing protein n=1 Tax=Actinoalloteichus caeruleus DSM 43889 TaxID=1120930 RepID=A0ABT1JKL2_ACTCY|nr:DUF6802 family protein [Actinoalloteichus caeruleus]MCP2333052.1 hypothetical protein [Actinoalloteichus caeruleus DSM 43889]
MYIEGEAGDTTGDSTDLRVVVDGQEYTGETNHDFSGDGTPDSVLLETDDGYLVFTDSDGDGEADLLVEYDEHGNVTGTAGYDQASGGWVASDPERTLEGNPRLDIGELPAGEPFDDASYSGDSILVRTPGGPMDVGAPTEDMNGDGVADTSVVVTEDDVVLVVSDVDGDGDADLIAEFHADGTVVLAEHTGGGEWVVVEQGGLDAQGQYVPDTGHHGAVPSGSDEEWGDEATDARARYDVTASVGGSAVPVAGASAPSGDASGESPEVAQAHWA